jgi:hypothetical protein
MHCRTRGWSGRRRVVGDGGDVLMPANAALQQAVRLGQDRSGVSWQLDHA